MNLKKFYEMEIILMFQQAIDKIIPIRLHSYEELLGADYFEHDIRHPSVGVSRFQNIFFKLDLTSRFIS